MMGDTNMGFAERLNALDEAQLKYVYGRLLSQLESGEPVLTESELEARTEEEKGLIQEVASELQVTPTETASQCEGAIRFLVAVSNASPEHARIIQDALRELDEQSVKLDFGLTAFAVGTLVVAIAAAIIRPRVEFESSKETATNTEKRRTKLVVDVRGVDKIADVIRAVMPFLNLGSG